MVDMEKLNAGLTKLTGLDLEQAAREERGSGNNAVLLDTEKSFQARIAAKALGMNVHDLKALPIKEYNRACNAVMVFLNAPDSETATG